MKINLDFLSTLVFALVIVSWFAFGAVFFLRRKTEAGPEQKRVSGSILGVALQGVSYALVWAIHRPAFSPIVSASQPVEIVIALITLGLAFASVWVVMAAVRTLGKEWSVTARLVEGHNLATSGPYQFVRHPIYSSMLGMLLATGLAVAYWFSLLLAIFIFLIGTVIRVRSEEQLLSERFGADFEAYRKRVPAMLPGIF